MYFSYCTFVYHTHNDFMEPENEMTTCPISIRIVVYLIVSSPNIFCHDINNPILYSGIEPLWVVIFLIF